MTLLNIDLVEVWENTEFLACWNRGKVMLRSQKQTDDTVKCQTKLSDFHPRDPHGESRCLIPCKLFSDLPHTCPGTLLPPPHRRRTPKSEFEALGSVSSTKNNKIPKLQKASDGVTFL